MNLTNWEIVLKLYQLSQDLLWTSESDYPFVAFFWELEDKIELDIPTLLKITQNPPDTPVKTLEFESFFTRAVTSEDWHEKEEEQNVKRYQNLVATLPEYLTDLQVYKVGEITIDVYILGRTYAGDLAGLSTVSIET